MSIHVHEKSWKERKLKSVPISSSAPANHCLTAAIDLIHTTYPISITD